MRHRLLLVFLLVCVASPTRGQIRVFGQPATVMHKLYPNSPQKDQIGDVPWISRGATNRWFPATLIFKDQTTTNCPFPDIDYARLWGKNANGVWEIDEEVNNPALTSEYLVIVAGVNLNDPRYAGYAIGSRIDFRWEYQFDCDGFPPAIHRDQYFQVMLGEPLPLFPHQYAADLHYHGFYTDDALEFGGPKAHLHNPFGGGYPSIVGGVQATGIDIVHWTDHGYDLTPSECIAQEADAANFTTDSFLVLPGVEGHIAGSNGWLHAATDACVRTPINFPIGADNTGDLWSLQTFMLMVQENAGTWYACHPWAGQTIEGRDDWGTWGTTEIDEAMADPNFVGWQVANRNRTSTKESIDLYDDVVDPYPWTADPHAYDELFAGVARVDSIQQAYLSPLRRTSVLAGSDAHGDLCYATRPAADFWPPPWNFATVDNNAPGRFFTVTEMPSFTVEEHQSALRAGHCYISNGPGLRFGVDQDDDGILETTFGDLYDASNGGTIRLFAQSNDEFGPLTQATLYMLTATTKDSITVSLSGFADDAAFAVTSVVGSVPTFIRAMVKTAGGYSERGLALTGSLYFNTVVTSVYRDSVSPPRLLLEPNPVNGTVLIHWSALRPPTILGIYDLHGRRVRTYAYVTVPFSWNGRDDDGRTVSSGIYVVRALFGERMVTAKITIVR